MNTNIQQYIKYLQRVYAYEITEGFCEINAMGKLQHTTNQGLGIADDVGEGLEDVVVMINDLLRRQ